MYKWAAGQIKIVVVQFNTPVYRTCGTVSEHSMVFCIVKIRSENSNSQFSLPVPKINNPETSKAVIRPSRQTINYDLRVNNYNTSHIQYVAYREGTQNKNNKNFATKIRERKNIQIARSLANLQYRHHTHQIKSKIHHNFKAISDTFSIKLLSTRGGGKDFHSNEPQSTATLPTRSGQQQNVFSLCPTTLPPSTKQIFQSRFNNLQMKKYIFVIPYCSFSYNSCRYHFTYKTQQKHSRSLSGIQHRH